MGKTGSAETGLVPTGAGIGGMLGGVSVFMARTMPTVADYGKSPVIVGLSLGGRHFPLYHYFPYMFILLHYDNHNIISSQERFIT